MTITLDITPEVQAKLAQQAAAQGRALEAHAASLLAEAVHISAEPPHKQRTGRALIDASAKVRGLLSDEEVDTLFSRTSSLGRPVHFE